MKLYHGTKTPFQQFAPALAGTNTADVFGIKQGLWLTDTVQMAQSYGPVVLAVEVPDSLRLRRFGSWEELESELEGYESEGAFIEALRRDGYQGVIFYQAPWASGQDIGIFDSSIIEALEFEAV